MTAVYVGVVGAGIGGEKGGKGFRMSVSRGFQVTNC